MSCELLEKIGTGDCELSKNCKSDIKLVDNLASELVVEILENALEIVDDIEEKPSNIGGDIIDTMDSISHKFENVKFAENHESSESNLCKKSLKGLGDQLKADEDILTEEFVKHPAVEKKNKFADLVKNSKQILSKLISSENSQEPDFKNEKIMRIVDLDSKDKRYKSKQTFQPENVPLPPCESSEILREVGKEKERKLNIDKMEEIELASTSYTSDIEEIRAKTMTFPMAGPSDHVPSLMRRYRTLKFTNDLRHKNWNIGSKIINFIKKKGQQRRSVGKETKASNGIEINPKEDNI